MSNADSMSLSSASDTPFLGPRTAAMELQELTRRPIHHVTPTLGELLQRVGDAQTDSDATPDHHVLEVSDNPTSSPFVLAFNNLTYSVKIPGKVTVPACFRRRREHELPENMVESNTKVLLNDVSGEAREGDV